MARSEHSTMRMMREMAEQIRQLLAENLALSPARIRHLADQLEQNADRLEAEIAKGRLH